MTHMRPHAESDQNVVKMWSMCMQETKCERHAVPAELHPPLRGGANKAELGCNTVAEPFGVPLTRIRHPLPAPLQGRPGMDGWA